MEIITEGDITRVAWWNGQEATCQQECGTTVRLTADDAPYTRTYAPDREYAGFVCPVCGGMLQASRPLPA